MKFAKEYAQVKSFDNGVTVREYCQGVKDLPLDGAIAYFDNGVFGPKKNRVFAELFYVLKGTLMIDMDAQTYELAKGDMFIIPPGKAHTIYGIKAKVFIACSPAFDPKNVEFL